MVAADSSSPPSGYPGGSRCLCRHLPRVAVPPPGDSGLKGSAAQPLLFPRENPPQTGAWFCCWSVNNLCFIPFIMLGVWLSASDSSETSSRQGANYTGGQQRSADPPDFSQKCFSAKTPSHLSSLTAACKQHGIFQILSELASAFYLFILWILS